MKLGMIGKRYKNFKFTIKNVIVFTKSADVSINKNVDSETTPNLKIWTRGYFKNLYEQFSSLYQRLSNHEKFQVICTISFNFMTIYLLSYFAPFATKLNEAKKIKNKFRNI